MPCLLKRSLTFTAFLFALNAFSQSSLSYSVTNISNGSLGGDANSNVIDLNSVSNAISNGSTGNGFLTAIGFEFYFMGKPYTHFVPGQDGQLALGTSTSQNSIISAGAPNDLTRPVSYPPITSNAPVLAAFWEDLAVPTTGATIRTILTGTAPNRCRVIGWTARINAGSGTPDGVFQIRLYETTGVIEYIYGAMAIGSASSQVTASIGFTAGQNDNQFLALQDLANQTFTAQASLEPTTQSLVNSSTPGVITSLNSAADGSRKGFRFTPPPLIGSSITGLQITNIGATTMTVNWTDTYSNEVGYAVYRSTDNINYALAGTVGSNANSFAATGLTLGTNYYWKVKAFTEGSTGQLSSSVNAVTACGLSGTYQVGPGGQYASLSAAAASLQVRGMNGSVLFELMADYSSAGETFPIVFPKRSLIPCMGSSMQVTVRPAASATDVQITGTEPWGLFNLEGCNYLTIDGRPGGIGNTNAITLTNNTTSTDILLNNASKNVIRNINCVYTGATAVGYQEGLITLSGFSNTAGCDSNQIISCNIYSSGLTLPKNSLLVSLGTPGGAENDGNQLVNCNVYNFSTTAIDIRDGNNGWLMQGNSFYNTGQVNLDMDAKVILINTPTNTNNHVITGNYFGGTGPLCSGAPMPIAHKNSFSFIYGDGRFLINQNQFKRIVFNNTALFPNASVAMVKVGFSPTSYSFADLTGNQFGGSDPADSIHLTQNFTSTEFPFQCLQREAIGEFNFNKASNIHCYSSNWKINLTVFDLLLSSGLRADSNQVGDPAVANSITNFTNGMTTGMIVSGTKFRGNRVCRITTVGNLEGLNVAGDTVLNNEVFHLISNIKVTGMSVGGSEILSNKIYALHSGGSVTGIYSGAWHVDRNLVYGLSTSGSGSGASITGIKAPSNNSSSCRNNMVRLGLDSLGNSISNPVFITGIDEVPFAAFNTVVIAGSNVLSTFNASYCYYYPTVASPPLLWNNIFINQRSNAVAGTARHLCVAIPYTSSQSDYCNYNLYHAPGPDNYVGSSNNTSHKNITTWTSSFNFDINGKQADPLLVNQLALNAGAGLHLQKGSPAESMGGSSIATATAMDFDNEIRNNLTPVDVGADAGHFVKPYAGADTIVCTSTSIQLGEPSSPNLTYSWESIPAGFSSTISNPVVSPASTTTYIVTASNSFIQQKDTVVVTLGTVTPTAVITSTANTICPGQPVTFYSTITYGGGTPSYQWKVNGTNAGTNNPVFASSALADGSQVQLEITSSISCASPSTATSNTITINVNPAVTPTVTVQASETSICPGQTVTFNATPVNGGSSPSYQWLKNGQNAGGSSSQFSTSAIANGDQFQVQLTSNAACATTTTASSNTIAIQITTVLPLVAITGNSTVYYGQSSLISSTISNGGTVPVYQWQDSTSVTGWANIAGATNATINYTPAVSGVKLRCLLTSNSTCVSTPNAASDPIQFVVNTATAITPVNTSLVSISPNPAQSSLVVQNLQLQDHWKSLEVWSILGQEALASQNIAGLTQVQVDVRNLTPGSYMLILVNQKGARKNFRFIKI